MKELGSGSHAEGRYKIIGVLGQGGMGTVYAAEDRRLPGKQWAIKEIREDGLGKSGMVAEARTLIKLSHPNLPHIVDYFRSEDGKCGYVVMERIEGETLEERFERCSRQLPVKDIIRYAIQLCDVLSYLHSNADNPIIHRDLKPSNLLIDRNERIVLIDFGTARSYKSGHRNDTVRMGTIGFASPEQLADEQTDPRTDLYALGGVLFYLLSGGKYYMLANEPVAESIPGLSGLLVAIIERLLKTDRKERYPNAELVKADLEQIKPKLEQAENCFSSLSLKRGAIQKNRLIVLLSLYPGAGSTTIGLTAAGLLDQMRIDHAYIEHPNIDPVLELWLTDRFWMNTVWQSEEIRSRDSTVWSSEDQLRLLLMQTSPITLMDISHRWEDDLAAEILQLADEILVVTGDRKIALLSNKYIAGIERLTLLAEQGKSITVCYNDCKHAPANSMIIQRMPNRRSIKLAFNESLRKFEWNGSMKHLMNDPSLEGWRKPIHHWLTELLLEWGIADVRDAGRSRWFRKLFKYT